MMPRAIGSRATLRLGDIRVDGVVTELRPLGEFATWRAARAVGDHDLTSFRVRFDPSSETTEVEPGMTALLTVSRQRSDYTSANSLSGVMKCSGSDKGNA